ncbi:MAG TPA: hypothetical protein VGH28_19470 [Polyangiaceae bacterium]|jgi:hypothetical protein
MRLARVVFVAAFASVPLVFALTADAQRGRGHHATHAAKDAGAGHHIEVGRDGGSDSLHANPDGGVVEAKTLDGGTRVFRFGELDVEGRLTSPQIVYFLRRVRAEFAAGDLGHRSFMGELSETRKSNAF